MRAAVDIAEHGPGGPNDKAGELRIPLAEPEPPRARLIDPLQRTEGDAGGRPGRVQASPPTVTRQGRTVEVSNRPAAL